MKSIIKKPTSALLILVIFLCFSLRALAQSKSFKSVRHDLVNQMMNSGWRLHFETKKGGKLKTTRFSAYVEYQVILLAKNYAKAVSVKLPGSSYDQLYKTGISKFKMEDILITVIKSDDFPSGKYHVTPDWENQYEDHWSMLVFRKQ